MRPGRVLLVLLLVGLLVAGVVGYRYYWLHRYDAVIARVAPAYRLKPELVWAIIYQESYFNTHAESRAGARGLMQVTEPVLAEWRTERAYRTLPQPLERQVASGRLTTEELLETPEINVHIGCWYLSKLVERFGDEPEPLVVALAAYNAGAANAERWRAARPRRTMTREARVAAFIEAIDYPETKNYVLEIRDRYRGR